MHPYLMEIPNRMFYKNGIQNDKNQAFKFFIHKDRPLLFVDIPEG
jgi:superfamily I DNA and/or RNA helicase